MTYNNDMIVIYPIQYMNSGYVQYSFLLCRNRLEIVIGRPFLFRIPTKDTVVLFYSTLSPQKCTKLNTEKQNAQGHLGSNLIPKRENRNFRKTVITNSTKPLYRPRGYPS